MVRSDVRNFHVLDMHYTVGAETTVFRHLDAAVYIPRKKAKTKPSLSVRTSIKLGYVTDKRTNGSFFFLFSLPVYFQPR